MSYSTLLSLFTHFYYEDNNDTYTHFYYEDNNDTYLIESEWELHELKPINVCPV